jgi:hypothetical protein
MNKILAGAGIYLKRKDLHDYFKTLLLPAVRDFHSLNYFSQNFIISNELHKIILIHKFICYLYLLYQRRDLLLLNFAVSHVIYIQNRSIIFL